MAKGPEDSTIRVLMQIQQTLADQGRVLADHTKQFSLIRRQLETIEESTVTALGFAAHANVRHEGVQKQIEALEDRVAKLEEKV